jgi:hypothetical protein
MNLGASRLQQAETIGVIAHRVSTLRREVIVRAGPQVTP